MRRRAFGMLALVLLFAALFTIATFTVGDDLVLMLHSNSGDYLQRKANFAAYAALQRSLSELDKSTSYDPDGAAYYTYWNPGESLTDVPMPGESEVFYTVRAFNNSQGQLGADFTHADGTTVPYGTVYLKVTTSARPAGNQRGRTYSADIASLSYVGQVHWQHVLLGAHRLTLSDGGVVDSFDSRESQPYPEGPTTRNGDTQATLGSNGQKDAIRLLSRSNVKGRVRWGPGGAAGSAFRQDPDVLLSGDARAGESLYRIPRFRPPYHPDRAVERVVVAAGETRLLPPGPYRSLSVEPGATVRLRSQRYTGVSSQAPRYYFDEGVSLRGGRLELVADSADEASCRVEVYVGESFLLTEGAKANPWVNASRSRSSRLQIFFVGNGGSSNATSQRMILDKSSLWAVVAGRGMSCTASNGSHFFGSLRAYDITFNQQSQAHWDKAVLADSRIRGLVAWTLQGVFQEKADPTLDRGGAVSPQGLQFPSEDGPVPAGNTGPGSDPSQGGGL